jgi:hypothetical protein
MTREEYERIIRQMVARYHVDSAYKDNLPPFNDPVWDVRFSFFKDTPADQFKGLLEFILSGKARNYFE